VVGIAKATKSEEDNECRDAIVVAGWKFLNKETSIGSARKLTAEKLDR